MISHGKSCEMMAAVHNALLVESAGGDVMSGVFDGYQIKAVVTEWHCVVWMDDHYATYSLPECRGLRPDQDWFELAVYDFLYDPQSIRLKSLHIYPQNAVDR